MEQQVFGTQWEMNTDLLNFKFVHINLKYIETQFWWTLSAEHGCGAGLAAVQDLGRYLLAPAFSTPKGMFMRRRTASIFHGTALHILVSVPSFLKTHSE